MKIFLWTVAFFLLLPVLAEAGVTIHYSGQVSTEAKKQEVLRTAEKYAIKNNWKIKKVEGNLILYPAEWCEPIELIFKGSKLTPSFVKTQFAGPAVHKKVVELFKILEPLMDKLLIRDEGKYWPTGDSEKLETAMNFTNAAIAAMKSQNPRAISPVKTAEGRILDIIQ